MKVILCPRIIHTDAPTHLHMEPESDRDRNTLERLIRDGHTVGFGREPEGSQVIHAQLPLK